ELSALHNHLLHETPRVMFIHFVGRGDEVELAKGLREALALTKSPLGTTPSAPETKPELATEIERIIGYQGTMGGERFHITVPRNDLHVASMGTMISGSMGMNTPFNFQLDGNNAAINGDGNQEYGTGLVTSYKQLVSDQLGVDPDRVDVIMGDTDRTPSGL